MNPTPSVAVNIVTWNSVSDLPDCLRSIERQTLHGISVRVIDNDSRDGTQTYVAENFPHVHLVRNNRNLGYARAHNQGIHLSRTDVVVCMNPDVVLEPTCLERLVAALASDARIGSACGKLLRSAPLNGANEPAILDAAGLKAARSRRVVNRGEGELDRGQFDKAADVFGFSGALVAFSRPALDDAAVTLPGMNVPEFFDEDFFAYKEDVDLSWRLLRRGWRNRYVPTSLASHRRGARIGSAGGPLALVAKYRRKKSQIVNRYSYKNHLLLILKNEVVSTFLPDALPILAYELRKFFYLLVAEQRTLPSVLTFLRQAPRALAKRRLIREGSRVRPSDIRRRFFRP